MLCLPVPPNGTDSSAATLQDAVALALESDFAQAAAVANKPQDEALKRKLWLSIARHIIQQKPTGSGKQSGTDQTVRCVRSNGLGIPAVAVVWQSVFSATVIWTSCGDKLAASACQLQQAWPMTHRSQHRLCVISRSWCLGSLAVLQTHCKPCMPSARPLRRWLLPLEVCSTSAHALGPADRPHSAFCCHRGTGARCCLPPVGAAVTPLQQAWWL